MPIQLIDPTVAPEPDDYSLASRLPIEADSVVGLVINGKPNADAVLTGVADRLEARFGFALERVAATKPNASRVLGPDLVDLIASRCNFALVGVGD